MTATDQQPDGIIPIRMRNVNGEWMMSTSGCALLFGVPADQFHDQAHTGIPPEWVRQARRRTKEARAHTGSENIIDILAYWAATDHNAVIEITEETP